MRYDLTFSNSSQVDASAWLMADDQRHDLATIPSGDFLSFAFDVPGSAQSVTLFVNASGKTQSRLLSTNKYADVTLTDEALIVVDGSHA